MSSHWVDGPGHGAFVLSPSAPAARPELVRALIRQIIEGLELSESDIQITASVTAKWRGFSWKAIDQAIANPKIHRILMLVGTPSKTLLGAGIYLRAHPAVRDRSEPVQSWVLAESARWPAARMVPMCRRWLATAAELGEPLSGGVSAASDLLLLKNDVSLELEAVAFEPVSPADHLFQLRVRQDKTWEIAKKGLRRLYPITLLGPRFASASNAEKLRAAGAAVETVGRSLLVDTYPEVIAPWSPPYLAATVALRRLAWPVSAQNPADAAGLGIKDARENHRYDQKPSWEPTWDQLDAELKRQTKELDALLKANPPPPPSGEALEIVA